jgi:hypothetical protein
LRTVGDTPDPGAKEKERPVEELPKVRGREDVWRVSFGRDAMAVGFGGAERLQAMVAEVIVVVVVVFIEDNVDG